MRVSEAIREAAQELAETSETARLDAELLMAHALCLTRSEMLLRATHMPQPDGFCGLIERRKKHEPVAYIIGQQEFFGRQFKVTPDVLIPRPDSETVIEAALDAIGGSASARVLDLGTGSGCLLLTILAERGAYTGVGLDRSKAALEVAKQNAQRLGLEGRARFELLDWHELASGQSLVEGLAGFDLVIANPPYVEDGAELRPDVRDFEPSEALFAGSDGLDDYRAIIPMLRGLLRSEGSAVIELGATQADAVGEIAAREGFAIRVRNDLANRPRALVLS